MKGSEDQLFFLQAFLFMKQIIFQHIQRMLILNISILLLIECKNQWIQIILLIISINLWNVYKNINICSYINKKQAMDWLNKVQKINNKFRFQLFGKNRQNLQACYNRIADYDPEGTGLLSDHAFNLFLNSFGVFLTTQEIRHIKDVFNQNGKIKFLDYIQFVRTSISEKRKAAIDHSFNQLSSNGVIDIEELMSKFDENKHPHARCMLRDPPKIRLEYQEAIRRRSSDGKHLTQNDFKEYYLDANACIPYERQQFFVDLLINSFRLLDNRVTIERLKQMQVTVYEKVRQKTYVKKDEGDKAKGNFKFFDMEDKRIVDYKRFVQTMQRLNCNFTQKEMKTLYQKHAGADGILTYDEMCGLLFDMGSGVKDNVNPIFETSKGLNGIITSQGMSKKLS